ncbi:MAG: 5-dehydro-2-deoxygluconokinase [Micromonosporaceae bacterium]
MTELPGPPDPVPDAVSAGPQSSRVEARPQFDVIAIGRLGVDLYPHQTGVALPDVDSFGKYLGGSAANVAVAATRLGRRTALISRTGADPFGAYLRRELREFGVDARWVSATPDLPTPITFCEIFPPDDFPIYFYRQPKAPDLEIHPDELDLDGIRDARLLWLTGTGLSAEPSRAAHLTALAARDPDSLTVFDLDYRPTLWPSPEAATAAYQEALAALGRRVDATSGEPAGGAVVVGNLDECEIAVGVRDPHAATQALLAAGARLAVVKQGPRGVLARTAEETVELPPRQVTVVNGLGAGDAFGGALCHGLLAGWPLSQIIEYGNAAGALVASQLACSPAMPTVAEVEQLLSGPADA